MDFLLSGVIRLLALLPALTLHEFAHGYAAWRAGDPTAKMAGRVTLNPLPHLDPIGTLAILFFPIGWARPVPVNPGNFRHPGRDDIIVSVAGPGSNIVQAIFWALVVRLLSIVAPSVIWTPETGYTVTAGFLSFMILINFALAIFNLLPVGPLDGHHIMQHMLPYPQSENYRIFNQRYGMFLLLAIVFFGARFLMRLIGLPVMLIGEPVSGISLSSALNESGILRW